MKQLPRIAEALHTGAWAILPEVHDSMCEQFRQHCLAGGDESTGAPMTRDVISCDEPQGKATDEVGPKWRDRETGETGFWHPQVEVRGSVATIQVRGIIGKHLSTLAMACGGVDGALIAKQARNVAADPSITHCITYIDSPGGSCLGAAETAEAIERMQEAGKITIGFTDRQAASCGYYFLAACEAVFASRSAIVGSVSVFSAYLDISKAYEAAGFEVQMFRSGDVKGMGTRGKPWTDAEKAFAQSTVDRYSDQFKGFIKRRRPLVTDADMQGQYWPAEFAPKGFIDGTLEDMDEVRAVIEHDLRRSLARR